MNQFRKETGLHWDGADSPMAGVVVPMITPLREDRTVCEGSVQRLVASFQGRATALLPGLSSGEGSALTLDQWQSLVVYTLRHAQGLPVCPGIVGASPEQLLKRAAWARQMGAVGITVVVPPLVGRVAEAIDAIRQLVGQSPLPLFLYHEGTEGAVEAMIAALSAMCRLPGILGIKESSRRAEVVPALNSAGLPCPILQGWEDLLYCSPGNGGHAVALANLDSGSCAKMQQQPTLQLQDHIDAQCRAFQLFDEDWYAQIKRELWVRGVISTALTVH